jgi:hypothetical protein
MTDVSGTRVRWLAGGGRRRDRNSRAEADPEAERGGGIGRRRQKMYCKIKGVPSGGIYLVDRLREVVTAAENSRWL